MDMLLCGYANALTITPGTIKESDFIIPMKADGMEDHTILDASLVIAYFNVVNRLVLGLGWL